MDIASIPYKFQFIWAENATGSFVTDPIPATTTAPAASQSLGFPPETSEPIAAGGTPPSISDTNGMLKYLSAWAQWQQLGGPALYDATLQTNASGYPKNSLVMSVAYPGVVWMSLVDNNTSDPDTAGADWTQYPPHGSQLLSVSANFTVPAGVTRIYVEVWGGGGSGVGGVNGAGAGGGYAAGWLTVNPGDVISYVVGAGGTGGTSGGTSIFSSLSATGGEHGSAGASVGGIGSGGSINLQGQVGQDLDGTNPAVIGGNSPNGGMGGAVNSAGSVAPATQPGGGGGANAANGAFGSDGAQGLIYVRW